MKNILQEKSYLFALDLVNLYKDKSIEDPDYMLFEMMVQAAVDIGVNIEMASAGQTKSNFLAKMKAALSKAYLASFLIKISTDVSIIDNDQGTKLYDSAEELTRILTKTIITTRKNLKSK